MEPAGPIGPFCGKTPETVSANTDVACRHLMEDVRMPSIWIILAAVVGAINLRLMLPGVAAFLGVGRWSLGHRRRRHLTH